MNGVQANILGGIIAERMRQDQIHPEFPEALRMAILAEEVGEVGKALQEGDTAGAIEELHQVAAVAVRWIEHLQKETGFVQERVPDASEEGYQIALDVETKKGA